MPIEKCRGEKLKEQIVAKYNLSCNAHLTLLDGQDKQGCCGPLSEEYYHFQYDAKEGNETGEFFVGRHCALQFAELAEIDVPAKFTPLKPELSDGGGGGGTGGRNRVQWDPLNLQLYNGIHVILTMWNLPPKGKFKEILEWLRENPSLPTYVSRINKVNRVIERCFPGKTLTEAWSEFREDYPNLKEYNFHLLTEAMLNEND